MKWIGVALVTALVAHPVRLLAQDIDEGRERLRTGKYQEAITILSKVSATSDDYAAAQRDLVRAYATIGKYDDAENTARRATAGKGGAHLWNTLGEVLATRGKLAAAESAFTRSMAEHGSDSLVAALNVAVLHLDRGERERAMKEFDRFIDVYNSTGGASLTSEELVAVATAGQYLGDDNPPLFKDASKRTIARCRPIHSTRMLASSSASCSCGNTTSPMHRRRSTKPCR